MSCLCLSEAEKVFVVHGVGEDVRVDGRTRRDVRPATSLETDIVTHTSGSARLRLANTDVLVGVKAELDTPLPEAPGQGRLEFFVDCSANATPEFEGRGGQALADSLSATLQRAYNTFDTTPLCLLKGHQCWVLYVDILILECGGNLSDAVSMAVKAALYTTVVPKVTVTAVDGGDPELELSDDPTDGQRLDVMEEAPVLITLNRIGNHVVVDAMPEEEACTSASIVMAVKPSGQITTLKKVGSGSFHAASTNEAMSIGVEVAQEIHQALKYKLIQEENMGSNRKKHGFLK